MYFKCTLISIGLLTFKCEAASSGLIISEASSSPTNSILSTDYCLRRRALQPGVPCLTQLETSTISKIEPTVSGSIQSHSEIAGEAPTISTFGQTTPIGHISSLTDPNLSSGPSLTSPTPIPVVGLPDATMSIPDSSLSPAITTGPATTSTQFQRTATVTTGIFTVDTVTFTFDLLTKPTPRPENDGKSSAEQVHDDFFALVPKMKSAASVFDNLGSTFSAFSSAVSSPDATDDSVSKAGGGLLSFFHSAFSVAADIGTNLASMGLSELAQGSKLLGRFEQISVDIFDFGTVITNIEPSLASGLNLASGNTILGSSSTILKGIGIGEGLRELTKLAESADQSPSDTSPNPTPEPTPQSTPEPTIQSTPTTRPSTSTTATSTSSSASATETKIYSISTKQGTKVEDFYALINSLPDEGRGTKSVYPNLDWQVYGSYLTETQAAEVRRNPIIRTVVEDGFVDDEGEDEYSVLPKRLQARQDPYPMLNLESQPISPGHLNLLSQGPLNAAARRAQPELPISDYLMSSKGGEGITIFVIDTGIDPSHPEFVNSYTVGDHYVVPNGILGLPATKSVPDPLTGESVMIPFVPDPDNIMSDSRNHGSCVASLAAGRVYGVAKKAHLIPIKYKNSRGAVTERALQDAFMHVISAVMNKDSRKDGPPTTPGWAVLSFSQGFGHLTGKAWETRRDLMDVLLRACWKNDIVTVIAAGNKGDYPDFDLSQDIPACLGTPTNPLITVGASDSQGIRLPLTNKDIGLGGSITTNAQGDNMVRCVAAGSSGSQTMDGTSVAAPQIAGLAAYFLSLLQEELPEAINVDTAAAHMPGIPVFLGPSLTSGKFIGPDLHIKGTVSQAVKDYIGRMSYKRNPDSPDAVNVAYNGVEEGLCNVVLPNASFKRKRGGIVPRAGEGDLIPVVVSGVMAITASYPLPACPLSTSTSSTTSSSSASISSFSSVASVSSVSSTPEPSTTVAPITAVIVETPTSTSDSPPSNTPSPPATEPVVVAPDNTIPDPLPPPSPSPTPKERKARPCYKCNDNGDVFG